VSWLSGVQPTETNNGDTVHVWRLDSGLRTIQQFGVHPGLLVHNDDRLFPEFQGQDLASRGSARLEHRALDGATVDGLPFQAQGLRVEETIALITIGGNDLLRGLIRDTGGDCNLCQYPRYICATVAHPSCSAGQCVRSHVGR